MKLTLKRRIVPLAALILVSSLVNGCMTAPQQPPTYQYGVVVGQCSAVSKPVTTQRTTTSPSSHAVYFISGIHLYALNASDGRLLWCMYATRASASLSTQANVAMSLFRNGPPPLPDGFTGLTVNNGSIYASSMNGYVYAFQASSGILLWKQNTGFANTSAPVVVDNTVYVGSGTIYALNATDGSVLWNYPTSDVGTSSPVIVNGVLYAGSNSDRVYALNAATGVLLWQYTTDGMVSVDPIVANGTVFFGSGDDGAALYAINAQNGKLLWHNSLLLVASSLAFSNNILYAGADNNLYGLSTHNGAILWHYQVSTPLNTLIAHGILYVASGSSGMNAFDTGNGERLWHNTLNPMHIGETTQPVLLGDEVYVATIDVGISPSTVFLHALNASTGVEDWSATVSWDISTIDVAA